MRIATIEDNKVGDNMRILQIYNPPRFVAGSVWSWMSTSPLTEVAADITCEIENSSNEYNIIIKSMEARSNTKTWKSVFSTMRMSVINSCI